MGKSSEEIVIFVTCSSSKYSYNTYALVIPAVISVSKREKPKPKPKPKPDLLPCQVLFLLNNIGTLI